MPRGRGGEGRQRGRWRLTGCNITPRLGARWLQAADTWPAPRRPTQELWVDGPLSQGGGGGGAGEFAPSGKQQRRERKMKQTQPSVRRNPRREKNNLSL